MSILDESYAAYINLAHRADRNEHMIRELGRVGVHAERFEAIRTKDYVWDMGKYGVMMRRTPGAIGCHVSQCGVMQTALSKNKNAFVMEDDLDLCSDIHKRLNYIDGFLYGKQWDIIWLGGTIHMDKPWWHSTEHPDMKECSCTLNKDYDLTGDEHMIRTYGAFSTHAYIVNKYSIEKVLKALDEKVHLSMGIDWLMILHQPIWETYMFLPGIAKQMDNISDIGQGMTVFSGFKMLGKHWWADSMDEYKIPV